MYLNNVANMPFITINVQNDVDVALNRVQDTFSMFN